MNDKKLRVTLIILNEIMKISKEINDNLKDTNWFIKKSIIILLIW